MKTKLPTPRQLPSGTWRCQVRVNGTVISVTDEDPKVCQAKAVAIQSGVIEKEKKQKSMTLEQAIDNYIDDKDNSLAPSTVCEYRRMKEKRFRSLMKQNIYNIKKSDVQRAVNAEAKLVSAKTVYNAYGLVRPVLKMYGIDVFGVKLPQIVKPNLPHIEMDEVGKLIEAAHGDMCELEILLAVWLGMRRSEICGLCWDCVDFENKLLTIRRTYTHGKDGKMELREGAKNASSQRILRVPDYVMSVIRFRYDSVKNHDGRISTVYPNVITRHVHAVCEKAGITDTHTHGLRHTNAAVMSHLGISDAHAMARGGWTSERTYKERYSYVFSEIAEKEDETVDRFFDDVRENVTRNVTRKNENR